MPGTFKTKQAFRPALDHIFTAAGLFDAGAPNGLDDILEDEEVTASITEKEVDDITLEVECDDSDVAATHRDRWRVRTTPLKRDILLQATVTVPIEVTDRLRCLYRDHTSQVIEDTMTSTIGILRSLIDAVKEEVEEQGEEDESLEAYHARLAHVLDCWSEAVRAFGPPTAESVLSDEEAARAILFNLKDTA